MVKERVTWADADPMDHRWLTHPVLRELLDIPCLQNHGCPSWRWCHLFSLLGPRGSTRSVQPCVVACLSPTLQVEKSDLVKVTLEAEGSSELSLLAFFSPIH